MTKQVKIITFILEHGPGYESENVFSRSEAEWEIARLLSDGWSYLGTGGSTGAQDMKDVGMGSVILIREVNGQ